MICALAGCRQAPDEPEYKVRQTGSSDGTWYTVSHLDIAQMVLTNAPQGLSMRLVGNGDYKLWLSDSNGVDVVKLRPDGEQWVGIIHSQDVQIARGSTVDLADYLPD